MTLFIISFFAGVLTILAPCVLPLLPIILGASITDSSDKKRPYIIIASLSISIIIFTLLVQATTIFAGVGVDNLKIVSGAIIILFGLITIFPNMWKKVTTKLGFSDNSNKLLQSASQKSGNKGSIFMGFALGPVFTSCSPTYGIILSIIIAGNYLSGLINLSAYVLGLATILLAIALLGQKFIAKLKWASDPNGKFKKILGILFLVVGLAIITGFDKKIESKLIQAGWFGAIEFEQSIINKSNIK